MLDVKSLEKRWMIYKIKSKLPYFLSALMVIFLVIFLIQKDEKTAKHVEIVAVDTPIKKETLAPLAVEKDTQKNSEELKPQALPIAPSMGFMENIKASQKESVEPKKSILVEKVEKKEMVVNVAPVAVTPAPVTPVTPVAPVVTQSATQEILDKKPTLSIERKNRSSDIEQVIKRFQTDNNPALSLFIAKKYYEMGNFEGAYNYALATNRIKSDMQESWIIFSKSLVKLGKRDEAIKTLKQYISFSNSAEAKQLLEEINSGKFK